MHEAFSRVNRASDSATPSAVDEAPDFSEELGKSRFMLKQNVIAALQRHKPRSFNPGRKLSPAFERDGAILRAMKHEGWRGHAVEQIHDIEVEDCSCHAAAFSGEMVLRWSSSNHLICSGVPSGTKSEANMRRNAGLS
jgi:hypothetical protein